MGHSARKERAWSSRLHRYTTEVTVLLPNETTDLARIDCDITSSWGKQVTGHLKIGHY